MARILVIGGYGAFGSRVAERLARDGRHEIVIAGRTASRAAGAATTLAARCPNATITSAVCDAMSAAAADIAALAPRVVINASGPFQAQDYALARACIGSGSHYIDLADARAFVAGIGALDTAAKSAGVSVISGASTVPGLSSAVVAAYRDAFARLETIDIGVSPGNHFDPGLATTQSILGYVGRPIPMRIATRRSPWRRSNAPTKTRVDREMRTVHGWQGLVRHRFPGLGHRLMGYAEVPDLDLFPGHDPNLKTVRMVAGVEVAPFHLGLWAASWLVRAGLIRDLPAWAPLLLAIKRRFRFLGTDRGAMFVTMTGVAPPGKPRRLDWHLIARSAHGPYVPALPSVILALKLANGAPVPTGAMPCFELFTLAEFATAAAGLDLEFSLERTP